MPPGILAFPKIADCFGGLIQPLTIREQREEFDGTEKLYRVWPGPAQRPQLARADENRDIFRRA
jgi:hypothetical protein